MGGSAAPRHNRCPCDRRARQHSSGHLDQRRQRARPGARRRCTDSGRRRIRPDRRWRMRGDWRRRLHDALRAVLSSTRSVRGTAHLLRQIDNQGAELAPECAARLSGRAIIACASLLSDCCCAGGREHAAGSATHAGSGGSAAPHSSLCRCCTVSGRSRRRQRVWKPWRCGGGLDVSVHSATGGQRQPSSADRAATGAARRACRRTHCAGSKKSSTTCIAVLQSDRRCSHSREAGAGVTGVRRSTELASCTRRPAAASTDDSDRGVAGVPGSSGAALPCCGGAGCDGAPPAAVREWYCGATALSTCRQPARSLQLTQGHLRGRGQVSRHSEHLPALSSQRKPCHAR